MEDLDYRIAQFLSDGSGYGSGYGSGSGSGYGYGDGSGDGVGYGYGSGSGSGYGDGVGYGDGDGDGDGSGDGVGDGYGYGDGYGIKELNGRKIYLIDNLYTLIDSVHSTYAKGSILNSDFTQTPCFIAKVEGCYFAHGETLHKAFEDAMTKALKCLPEEERINKFVAEYPDRDMVVKNTDLFVWHSRLTWSCEQGRKVFAREHGIDVENDSMTVSEFIDLTENSYGGETIVKLKKRYE